MGSRAPIACAVLSVACAACSGRSGAAAGAPARDLELWVAPVVHWDAGQARSVNVAVENGAYRTLALARPDPANAGVAVFRGADGLRVCGVDPHPDSAAPARRVDLPPGDSVAMRIDLSEACAGLPPGDYRFEVAYRSPPVDGGNAFSGALGVRHGVLLVAGGGATATTAPRPGASSAGRTPPRR